MMKRIGAGTYLLSISASTLIWSAAVYATCIHLALPGTIDYSTLRTLISAAGMLFGVVFFSLSAGRLRDLNFPGWSVKVLAFPLLAAIILPVLCFLSGPRWDHDYGEAPAPSGMLKCSAALILFLVAIFVANSAIGTFYQTRYLLLHGSGPASTGFHEKTQSPHSPQANVRFV